MVILVSCSSLASVSNLEKLIMGIIAESGNYPLLFLFFIFIFIYRHS